MALGADWEILADLRIDAPPDRITADYLLLHAEYGIALLKFGAPRIADTVDVATAERFRRFLRERGFEIFFPGYLPIVRLSIGVQEAPFAGRLVAEAFACVPRLTVTDPAWAEAIGTVLTSTAPDEPVAEPAQQAPSGDPPISRDAAAAEPVGPTAIMPDKPAVETAADTRLGESPLSREPGAPAIGGLTATDKAATETVEGDVQPGEPSTPLDPSVRDPLELTAIAPDAAAVEAVAGDAPQDEPPMSFGRGLGLADGAVSRWIERPRRSAALRVLFHRLRRGLVGHEAAAETVEDVRQRESSVSLEPPPRDSAGPASTGVEIPMAELAADVQRGEPISFEPPVRESTEPPPIRFDEPVTEMLADAQPGEPLLSLDMSAPEPALPISTGPGEAMAELSEDARRREPSTSLDPSTSVGGPFELTAIAPDAAAVEAVTGDAPRDEPPMSFGRGLDQADGASSRSIERPRRSAALRVLFHRFRRGLVGHEVTAETVEDVRQRESSVSLEPSTRDSAEPASTGIEAPTAGLAADVQRGEPISFEPPVRESTEPPPIRLDEPMTEMLADAPRGEPSLSLDMSAPEPAGSISTGPISTGPGEATAEPSEDARQREPSTSLDPSASVGGSFEPTVIASDAVAAEAVAGDAPRDEPPMSLGRGLDQADEASSRSIERPRRSAALGVLFHRLRRGLVGHEATAETVEGVRRDEPPMLRDPSVSVRDPVEFELTPTETAEQAAETVAAARRREPPMPLDPSASVRDLFELTPMETAAPATETTEDVRWVEPILLHPLVRHAGDLTPARFGAPTAHRMADTRRRAPLMLFDLPALDHAGNIAPKVTWLLPEAVSRGELSASFYSEAHGVPSIGEPTVDDVWIPGASVEVRLDMALQADRALRIARAPSPRRWRPGSRLLACIMLAVGVVSLWFAPTDRPTGLLTVPPRGNPPPAGPVKQPPESNATGLAPERPPTAMARSDRRAETPRHIRPGASSRTHAVYAGRSRSLDGWPLPPSKD